MADATYEVLELRAVIESELTRLYILCGPDSDGGMLVGGWYTKTIPASEPALDALAEALTTQAYLVKWDKGAPPRSGAT